MNIKIESALDKAAEKINEYVHICNGMYREHVSDLMLKQLLFNSFKEEYLKYCDKYGECKTDIQNIAYTSSVVFLESYLEIGCGVKYNGHHAAQKFASLFTVGNKL
jgi:hypothetical protein